MPAPDAIQPMSDEELRRRNELLREMLRPLDNGGEQRQRDVRRWNDFARHIANPGR